MISPSSTSRSRLVASVVISLVAALLSTALAAAPSGAVALVPDAMVGVADRDFNVRGATFGPAQRATVAESGSFAQDARQVRMWFRLLGDGCERDITVRLTNPTGASATWSPFDGCDGQGRLLHETVYVDASTNGDWIADFAYAVADSGEPVFLSPSNGFSVRAVRIDAVDNSDAQRLNLDASPRDEGLPTFVNGSGFELSTVTSPPSVFGGAVPLQGVGPEQPSGPEGPRRECPNSALAPADLRLNAKLEGPLDVASGLMRDTLRATASVPLIDPYLGTAVTSAQVLSVSGDNAIVDWVMIEVRRDVSSLNDPQMPSRWTLRLPALIQRDGDIVDVDGVSPLQPLLWIGEDYRLIMSHRSHLQTAFDRVSHTGTATIIESLSSPALGGDFNGDGDINGMDKAIWQDQNGTFSSVGNGGVATRAYVASDVNMDGNVVGGDKGVWFRNNGNYAVDGQSSFTVSTSQDCEIGFTQTGDSITYPDLAFRPDHVSSYEYSVIVDQLLVVPDLVDETESSRLERNRMTVDADLSFTAFDVVDGSQWVQLNVIDPIVESTDGSYGTVTIESIDQSQPIDPATADSAWNQGDVDNTFNEEDSTASLATELALPTWFRRTVEGTVVEIRHGQNDSAATRTLKEGMVNLVNLELSGASDQFERIERDRGGDRRVATSASASAGTFTLERTMLDLDPGTTKGATIVVTSDGETEQITSTEIVRIDPDVGSGPIDPDDPFSGVAPFDANVWSRSTLELTQVAPTPDAAVAVANAATQREAATVWRSVLHPMMAQQLQREAAVRANVDASTFARDELVLVANGVEDNPLTPDVDESTDSRFGSTINASIALREAFEFEPGFATELSSEVVSGGWNDASAVAIIGALASVGHAQAQVGLVEIARNGATPKLRHTAVVAMSVLRSPTQATLDFLAWLATTMEEEEEDAPAERRAQGSSVDVIEFSREIDERDALRNSATLILGTLAARAEGDAGTAAIEQLQARSASAAPEEEAMLDEALRNYRLNGGNTKRVLHPGTPRAFYGHCGWDDGAQSWVSGGHLTGPDLEVSANSPYPVTRFGHPDLSYAISGTLDGAGEEWGEQLPHMFLWSEPANCNGILGTGESNHYYGHCDRQSDGTFVASGRSEDIAVLGTWFYSNDQAVRIDGVTSSLPFGPPDSRSSANRLALLSLAPGNCTHMNEGQGPPIESEFEGFDWQKQLGPSFVHADLYATLDIPNAGDRGATFRAEAGVSVTVAGREASVFRVKAESALDLIDEDSSNNLGANNQIGQIERDLTLESWLFNSKVIDREIGVPCGIGAQGTFFEVPSLDLGFSKTILIAGFIPVEFAGSIGAHVDAPWKWSIDACDIGFDNDVLVTIAGSAGIEGRAEAHLTAGINLIIAKGGGGVGGTIVGAGATARASLQLFRPSSGRSPQLCYGFEAALVPPSISAYIWYKMFWKKKKTIPLFTWAPTTPAPYTIGSNCPTVDAHAVTVTTEPGDKVTDPGGGPTFTNPTHGGFLIALPADAVQGLVVGDESSSLLRVAGGDSGLVADTVAAFCANHGYGAPVNESVLETADPEGEGAERYTWLDGAWGHAEATSDFQRITQISCSSGRIAGSTRIMDPTSNTWVDANPASGAVLVIPDPNATELQGEFRVMNVGDVALHDVQLSNETLGGSGNVDCGVEVEAGGSLTCDYNFILGATSSTQATRHQAVVLAALEAGGTQDEVGTFNWFTCGNCAPSGGTGTPPENEGEGEPPAPIEGLTVTDVTVKTDDVVWPQDADGSQPVYVETPASVTVEVTVKNIHTAPVADFQFQGAGLNGSGNCDNTTLDSGDGVTCRFTNVTVSTGLDARTVKAFATTANEAGTQVFSLAHPWSMFGEQPNLFISAIRIDDQDAMGGDPLVVDGAVIEFTLTNSQLGAVDLNGLDVSAPAVGAVSCPSVLPAAGSITCSGTLTVSPGDPGGEFTATAEGESVISDREVESTAVFRWNTEAPARPMAEDLEILSVGSYAPGTADGSQPGVTSAKAGDQVDVLITVQNNAPQTASNLAFELIGTGNSCTGASLAPGNAVDCTVSGVVVAAGANTEVVVASGSTADADVYSQQVVWSLQGSEPRIEITAIDVGGQSALDPHRPTTPGVAVVLTDIDLEEGVHPVAVDVLNAGSSDAAAVNIGLESVGFADIVCPAQIAVGTTGTCTATYTVIPSDTEISRTARIVADIGGVVVEDSRSWSYSYASWFDVAIFLDGEPAPKTLKVENPGSMLFEMQIINGSSARVLEDPGFGVDGSLALAAPGSVECVHVASGQPVVPASSTPLDPGDVVRCTGYLDITPTTDGTLTGSATVDGLAKLAEVRIVTSGVVVDIGEPPLGQEPSEQWGTGTGSFFLRPVAEGEAMPTSVTFAGRAIDLERFGHEWPDGTWEVEILPNRNPDPTFNELGTRTLSWTGFDGVVQSRDYHVSGPGEFDTLYFSQVIDVTNLVTSYNRSGESAAMQLSVDPSNPGDPLYNRLRVGSVLVSGPSTAAPDGFIQVVESLDDPLGAAGELARAATGTTAYTKSGDLLDALRKNVTNRPHSTPTDKNGAQVSSDFSVDFNFESNIDTDFHIEIDGFWDPEVLSFHAGATAHAGVSYDVSANVQYQAGDEFEILGNRTLVRFFIGIIPMTLNIGLDGVWSIDASASIGVSGAIGASASASVDYHHLRTENYGWELNTSRRFEGCVPLNATQIRDTGSAIGNTCFQPRFNGSFSASAGVRATVSLLVADSAGPSFSVTPTVTMSAGFSEDGVTYGVDLSNGLVAGDGSEYQRVLTGNGDAGTSDGVASRANATVVPGIGLELKGIAKKLVNAEINQDLGTVGGILLSRFSSVFGVVVNLCALGNGTITLENWKSWRPHGGTTFGLRWHGHHIVKQGGTQDLVEQNRQLLDAVGIAFKTSCHNLVWAPNRSTPGHAAGGAMGGWTALNQQLVAASNQGSDEARKAATIDVLEVWGQGSCEIWEDLIDGQILNPSQIEENATLCSSYGS